MSGIRRRTGDNSIRLTGQPELTGRQGAARYGDEAYGALFDWAPLPAPRPERLEAWTDKLAGTPAVDLLNDLHDRFGLEWQRVARLLAVSVPALNKWRHGGGLASETDLALRRLVGFSELLVDAGVGDVGAWFASTPVESIPLTRGDVYRVGGGNDLIASLSDPTLTETVLDRWLPRWRELRPSRQFHPTITFDDDGTVLAELAEIPGLLGVGATIDAARRALIADLRDYADQFDATQTGAGDAIAERVATVRTTGNDGELFRLVFGDR